MIVPLGLWVLEQACAEAAIWATHLGGDAPRVAVNLSPIQFRQPDLLTEISRILQRSGCEGSQLDLEVTEGLLLQEDGHVLDTMKRLKQQGVRLTLDDFGTGNAGLSYLRRFPFDKVKIDRSFIQSMTTETSARAIVEAILTLCRRLNLDVVAEGVETQQQLAALRDLGCGQLQGYFLGRPVAGERVLDALNGEFPHLLSDGVGSTLRH